MGFFGNLKKITTSTVKAINNGAELLADFAEEAEKSSEMVAARSHAWRLKKEIEELAGDHGETAERKEKKNELIATYKKIIEGTSVEKRPEFLLLKNDLEREVIEEGLKESLEVMERKGEVLLKGGNKLAIVKINNLNILLKEIDKIMASADHGMMSGSEYAGSVFLKCGDRRKEVLERIEKLEPERHVEKLLKYPSGKVKCKVLEYDGKRHGLSEYWYESGNKYKEVSFQSGDLCGVSRNWRDSGSIVSEVNYDPFKGVVKVSAYAVDGVKLVSGEIGKDSGRIEIWLWNGKSVGSFVMGRNGFNKKLVMLKVFTRTNVLKSLYKTRKPGMEREGLKESLATAKLFEEFSKEIVSMQMGQWQ